MLGARRAPDCVNFDTCAEFDTCSVIRYMQCMRYMLQLDGNQGPSTASDSLTVILSRMP